MAESYKKISSGAGMFLAIHKLYRTNEYLLLIQTSGYSEKYRRLYFKDIQSIQIMRTNLRLVIGLILGLLVTLFGLLNALLLPNIDNDEVLGLVLVMLGLPFLACLTYFVVNILKGPACRCVARTAVQELALPTLMRVRQAERVLGEIEPLINLSQGPLAREDLLAELAKARNAITAPAKTAPAPAPEPEAQQPESRIQNPEYRREKGSEAS